MRVPKAQKARGEWVELLFMAVAARYGLKVARPHGEARYDVIIESANGLFRVQVKSTLFKRRGCYECLCFWSRADGTRTAKQYLPSQIDFVAAYVVPEDSWFIIPAAEIRGKTLFLPPKKRAARSRYGKYREAWHLLGAVENGLSIEACAEVLKAVEEVAREQTAA
jgi:hypothetical protein